MGHGTHQEHHQYNRISGSRTQNLITFLHSLSHIHPCSAQGHLLRCFRRFLLPRLMKLKRWKREHSKIPSCIRPTEACNYRVIRLVLEPDSCSGLQHIGKNIRNPNPWQPFSIYKFTVFAGKTHETSFRSKPSATEKFSCEAVRQSYSPSSRSISLE